MRGQNKSPALAKRGLVNSGNAVDSTAAIYPERIAEVKPICAFCGYFRKRRRVFCAFTGNTARLADLACWAFAVPGEVEA